MKKSVVSGRAVTTSVVSTIRTAGAKGGKILLGIRLNFAVFMVGADKVAPLPPRMGG